MGFEPKDDFQLPSSQCAAEQLMTIAVLLVPTNLEVRKEAFNRFIECHSVFGEFIVLKVVLEIRWSKPMPFDHGTFYRVGKAFGIGCRPNDSTLNRERRESPLAKSHNRHAPLVGCNVLILIEASP